MIRKLGKCQKTKQDGARIWLQNKTLSQCGFVPGANYVKSWNMGKTPVLELHLVNENDFVDEWNIVSGKGDTPVIDITGWTVKQFFEGCIGYRATFEKGLIKLEGVKSE